MLRGLFVAAVIVIAGCSTSGTSVVIGDPTGRTPTAPENVTLLLQLPERPYEVIALVEGEAHTDEYLSKKKTEAAALTAMREEAALQGAHAIVLTGKDKERRSLGTTTSASGSGAEYGGISSGHATVTTTQMGYRVITFSGTAIRYTD